MRITRDPPANIPAGQGAQEATVNLASPSTARTSPEQRVNIFQPRPDETATRRYAEVCDQDAVTERHVFLDAEDFPNP